MNDVGADTSIKAKRKQQLRKQLRAARMALDETTAQHAADSVTARLRTLEAWSSAKTIGGYLALNGELDTTGVASAATSDDKHYFLPVVDGKQLRFRRWAPDEPLAPNRFGIGEPLAGAKETVEFDILIVPLVGWASGGARLGMGGGFYDRFLADSANVVGFRLGLAFEAQRDELIRELHEPWDQAMDGVITEKGFYDFTTLEDAR